MTDNVTEDGRVAGEQALAVPVEPVPVSPLTGFDPSRVVRLYAHDDRKAIEQRVTPKEWVEHLLPFGERARHHAANLAAHNWDVTIIGDRLLVSCAWSGGEWWRLDGERTPLSPDEQDRFYPRDPYDTRNPEALQLWRNAVHTSEGVGKPSIKRQRNLALPRDSDGSPQGRDGEAGSVHDSAAIAQPLSKE